MQLLLKAEIGMHAGSAAAAEVHVYEQICSKAKCEWDAGGGAALKLI